MILYVQQFLMLHHVSGKDFLYDSAVFSEFVFGCDN